jgi:hypothetical protein
MALYYVSLKTTSCLGSASPSQCNSLENDVVLDNLLDMMTSWLRVHTVRGKLPSAFGHLARGPGLLTRCIRSQLPTA